MSHFTKNKKDILHFIGAAYVNGYFWVSALEWNGYYRLNISTGQAEFLGLFSYADFWDDKLFNQILVYQKYVFYIPWFSDYLVRLDTETLDTKYWMLPKRIVSEIAKFRVAKIYEKKIFMFPHVGKDICIFDIENETFKCDRKWMDNFPENMKKDYFLSGFQKGNMLYLAHVSGNFMMRYNLKNYQQIIFSFPEHEKGIVDIAQCDKKELLILTGVGNVWMYDLESKKKECIYVYNGKVEYPYVHIIPLEKSLYLIPANENSIKKVNDAGEKELCYPVGWKIQNIDVGLKCLFWGIYREKNKIILENYIGKKVSITIDNDDINDSYLFSSTSQTIGEITACDSSWFAFKYSNKSGKKTVTQYFRIKDLVSIDEIK